MKKVFLLTLLIFSTGVFADKIITKSGIVYEGTVIRVTEEAVEYKTDDVPFLKVKTQNVYKIEYSDGSEDVFDKTAKAREIEEQNEFHEHKGFYLRSTLGLMRGSAKLVGATNVLDANTGFGGFGAHWRTEGGWAFFENLIFYGFGGAYAYAPFSQAIAFSGSANEEFKVADAYTFVQGGLGSTYYFMPANVYLSLSGGVSRANVNTSVRKLDTTFGTTTFLRDEEIRSKMGYGLYFALGYEWWASENWGLGLNVFANYAQHKFDNGTLSFFMIGISFSATYN